MLLLNGWYVFLGFSICYLDSSKVYGFKPFAHTHTHNSTKLLQYTKRNLVLCNQDIND